LSRVFSLERGDADGIPNYLDGDGDGILDSVDDSTPGMPLSVWTMVLAVGVAAAEKLRRGSFSGRRHE
jgi:hypothetical protein